MKTPMIAQVCGAVTNIILDPVLIFGMFGLPKMGIMGAAIATVLGQIVAAVIVCKKRFRKSPPLKLYKPYIIRSFKLGLPNILMQSAYTIYIFGLNMILKTFSDQAVTTLGLYYKWQSFFFIPLGAMQTCIVPVISYNYTTRNIERCKKTLIYAIYWGLSLMFVGILLFVTIPDKLLSVFSKDPLVIEIGTVAFRIIAISFIPLVASLTFPVFFQAIGFSFKSSLLTIIRTVVCFVPLAFIFSRFGLNYFWLTFPTTEVITTTVGIIFYRQFLNKDYVKNAVSGLEKQTFDSKIGDDFTAKNDIFSEPCVKNSDISQNLGTENLSVETGQSEPYLKPSKPGVIITIARTHGSSGKEIGKMVANKLGIPFYYKEMIALAAHESGLDKEFISNLHRSSPDMMRSLYLSSHVVQRAVRAQNKIIKKIAECGSCVIVGRAADYVLKGYKNLVRVFVDAPMSFRVERVKTVYGDIEGEAVKNIKRADKARAHYYKHISGLKMGR